MQSLGSGLNRGALANQLQVIRGSWSHQIQPSEDNRHFTIKHKNKCYRCQKRKEFYVNLWETLNNVVGILNSLSKYEATTEPLAKD